MAEQSPRQPMTLVQATITFMIAFFAVNIVIDALWEGEIAWVRTVVVTLLSAPIWYFFVKWMRSRRA